MRLTASELLRRLFGTQNLRSHLDLLCMLPRFSGGSNAHESLTQRRGEDSTKFQVEMQSLAHNRVVQMWQIGGMIVMGKDPFESWCFSNHAPINIGIAWICKCVGRHWGKELNFPINEDNGIYLGRMGLASMGSARCSAVSHSWLLLLICTYDF